MRTLLTTTIFLASSLFVQATFGQDTTATDETGGNEAAAPVVVMDSGRQSGPTTASDLSISISPASITGKGSAEVSVTLPASDCTRCVAVDRLVELKASDAACSIPSARIQGNSGTALASTVSVSCSAVQTDRSVTISEVTSSTIPASASLALIAPDLEDLVMRPKSVVSGGSASGRVKLNAPAISDMTVTLSSADPELAGVPASVVIPAGKSYADFPIKVGQVSAETVVRIYATCKDSGERTRQRALLTILPAP